MCLRLGYLAWSPDAFFYDLTTVGNQEAERLFALPSVLFSNFGSVKRPANAYFLLFVSEAPHRGYFFLPIFF